MRSLRLLSVWEGNKSGEAVATPCVIADLDCNAQLGELVDGRQCGQLGRVQEHQEALEEQVRFVLAAEAGLRPPGSQQLFPDLRTSVIILSRMTCCSRNGCANLFAEMRAQSVSSNR